MDNYIVYSSDNKGKYMKHICIIGAGLSGVECAYTLSQYTDVTLIEMRPHVQSPAHKTSLFAELVCSNSLRAFGRDSAIGLLKIEMSALGSLVMESAYKNQIPAGQALAVDRTGFSEYITDAISKESRIEVIHREICSLSELEEEYDTLVLATGPLTSQRLSSTLGQCIGQEYLYFYDAIAPIISIDSVDMEHAFWGSRYQQETEGGDYLNCPLTKEEYEVFYRALLEGEKVPTHNAEKNIHFEGCMPIESLAERGEKTLLFGCLKPVGIYDPKTGKRPYAVVQLRLEDHNKSACNLVGCQTRLLQKEQKRIFSLIPALRNAEFIRYGSVHRNTYIDSPRMLSEECTLHAKEHCYCIGQITGVEGYVESASTGLWLGHYLGTKLLGSPIAKPPATTALGALFSHIARENKNFQPSNATFGLMPDIEGEYKKSERRALYASRAERDFQLYMDTIQPHIRVRKQSR